MKLSTPDGQKKVRILVVDDHPFFRNGIVTWLNQQPELSCCGQADSVAAARKAVAVLAPEVILLDLRLGDGDGLDLAGEFSESHPAIRIIILSQREEDAYAHRALAHGARGYVMKSAPPETLLAAIHTVVRGEVYVSHSVAARLIQNLFPDPASTAPQLARLSDRELQVFQLLGAGLGNRQIAGQLKISPKTVETYRKHLKEKLKLSDSQALLKTAILWVEKGRLEERLNV